MNQSIETTGKIKSLRKNNPHGFAAMVCLAVCIVSMVLQYVMNTSFGSVEIRRVTTQTQTGYQLAGNLYVPRGATNGNPAPAVLMAHGSWRAKENMSGYAMELSRRGYVVFNFEQYGHGESGNYPLTGEDMYDAFCLVDELPFVDSGRIAATGHSSAGRSLNRAFTLAAEAGGSQFAALVPVDFEADTKDADGNWFSKYGNTDYGVVASKFDDWFFSVKDTDGTWLNAPKDYIYTDNAKSFLTFGRDPSEFQGTPEYGKLYSETIDGKETFRAVYQSNEIHAWSVLSEQSLGYVIGFLQLVLPPPNPIDASSQSMMLKEIISLAGLVALVLFVMNFALWLMRTRPFEALKPAAESAPRPAPKDLTGKLWFWGGLIASSIFAYVTIFPIMMPIYNEWDPTGLPAILPQSQTLCFALWAAFGGLFAILIMFANYHTYAKKNGFDLREAGIVMSRDKTLRTIAAAVLSVCAGVTLVFAADYFCYAHFGFWTVNFKVFRSEKILWMLAAAPLYLLYYVTNSISVNCFRYNEIGKKGNVLLLSLSNTFTCAMMVILQYSVFVGTGIPFWSKTSFERQVGGWLISTIILLFVAPITARKLYKKTGNPYLPGIINGLLVTIMSVAYTAQYY